MCYVQNFQDTLEKKLGNMQNVMCTKTYTIESPQNKWNLKEFNSLLCSLCIVCVIGWRNGDIDCFGVQNVEKMKNIEKFISQNV